MAGQDTLARAPGDNSWNDDYDADELPAFFHLFEYPTETLCEYGDAILIADDGLRCIKIHISTCILASASRVFKALFSRRFAEGQALSSQRQTPAEIQMHDTPAALLGLCKLLHFQGDIGDLTSGQLLDLAIVIDKYDCVDALRYAMDSILTKPCDWLSVVSLLRYAAAAYLLDQPKHFRHFTKKLILGEAAIEMPTDPRLDVLPASLIRKLLTPFHLDMA